MDTLNSNDTQQRDEAQSFLNFLPGQRLKRARELHGLSMEEVARALNLSLRFIEAIEQDRYDLLPEPVFVRGYMRSYARLLKLDDGDVAAKFDQALESRKGVLQEGETPVKKPMIHRQQVSRIAWLSSIALVVAMLAGGFIWSLREDVDHPEVALPMPPHPAAPVSAAPVPVPLSATPVQAVLATVTPPQVTTAVPQAAPQAQPVLPAPASPAVTPAQQAMTPPAPPAPPASPASPAHEVVTASAASEPPAATTASAAQLKVSADAWVQIKDANTGKVLFSGLQHPGTLALPGSGPWRLRIGNAQAVSLSKAGQAIDMTPYTRDHVATLTLQP